MSRLSSRAGIVTIALLSILTASLAVVVAVDSGGGPLRAAGSSPNKTLTVSGDGTGHGLPDTLVVDFSVHSHNSSVQAVLSDINTDGHKVLSTLRSEGVPGKGLQTTNLSLNPSYDNHGNITGYDASESITARIPLKDSGTVVPAVATSAGNSVNIDGISLDISDKSGPLNQARANAFAQALAAAQKDASLAHETLGQVLSIKETQQSSTPPQPYYGYSGAASAGLDAAKSIAVAPGRQDVTVTLDIVWSLD